MEAYHFGFVILAIIFIVSVMGASGPTKTGTPCLQAGDVFENIFDQRRATFVKYGTDFRKNITIVYVVEGANQEQQMPVNLFDNQFKKLNGIQKDNTSQKG